MSEYMEKVINEPNTKCARCKKSIIVGKAAWIRKETNEVYHKLCYIDQYGKPTEKPEKVDTAIQTPEVVKVDADPELVSGARMLTKAEAEAEISQDVKDGKINLIQSKNGAPRKGRGGRKYYDFPTWEEPTTAEGSPAYANNPEAVGQIAREMLTDVNKEHAIALILNTKNRIIQANVISIGSLNANIVHPREVFKPAIAASANAVILAHNHPSGDTEPSREDIQITRKLVEAGKILGIPLLDHVIIGDDVLSMGRRGYV